MRKNILLAAFMVWVVSACLSQKNEVLTPQAFRAMMKQSATVLDVRTPGEYKSAHLDKAININVNDDQFESQSNKIDKSKPVLVYCFSGARSKRAAQMLRKKGFTVHELKGGIEAWQKEGLAVTR